MTDGRAPPTARGFTRVRYPAPHGARSLRIQRSHPAVRRLYGRNWWSALIAAVTVSAQLVLAVLVGRQPLWLVLVLAWFVGAVATHLLWVLIHEATHNLVTHSKVGNRLVGIFANLPMLVPSSESFRIYHLMHHRYLGDSVLDPDIASPWEARLVGHGAAGKLLWELSFPLVQMLRAMRVAKTGRASFFGPGVIVNALMSAAFDVALVAIFGWGAAVYLGASLVFSIGPHPVAARWIQEHYLTDRTTQETYSYYGPFNLLALNVGYHNEHHDFPAVPWNRLPRVKALAPEVYERLECHRSWTRLWLRFLFDRNLTLFSRVVRDAQSCQLMARRSPRA